MRFLDCDLTGKKITLCGNYGDPIYHPEFHDLVSEFKQRGCDIHIVTNGSYQKTEWWQQLILLLDARDSVTFSVDGIPDNFAQYRVNADWPSIEQAMHICANSQVQTVWKYIVFSYNQHNIEAADQLRSQMGIDEFRVTQSDRFDQRTEHLKPTMEFLGSRYDQQQNWKLNQSFSEINPQCNNQKEHFISADGYYASCCFVQDHRFYYKTPFGKNKSLYNIVNSTFSEILNQPNTIEFYHNLSQQTVCQYNCPKIL
jgi:wyosine [tRNA(Phe)-imidazoG37] synthetase (radical SAM superfamily)